MMATARSTREPRTVPDRVAIETPRGDVRTGDVVDVCMEAEQGTIERWLTVSVDGHRYRVPADEATEAHL